MATNPFSFRESRQECCLTTAEGLGLLPAMRVTALGGKWEEPNSSRGPMAPSCSCVAPRPLQTDLSLTPDANVKTEGLFKLFYSRFTESKIKLKNLFLWEKIRGLLSCNCITGFSSLPAGFYSLRGKQTNLN